MSSSVDAVDVKIFDPLISVKKNKEIAAFLSEHDSTGAKQGYKFGESLSHTLDERKVENFSSETSEGVPQLEGLKRDESGKLIPSPDDKKHHIGMVTVVELDRLNTEGGHDAGNKAMASTVRVIEDEIQAVLLGDPNIVAALGDTEIEDIYDIFHTRGADFAYTLNLSALPDDIQTKVSQRIAARISQQRADTQGLTKEGSLLGVTSFSQEKAIEMFNTLQERVSAVRKGGIRDEDVKRYVIELMRKYGETELEKAHLDQKAAHFLEVLLSGDGTGAATYFQKYMEKKFAGTSMTTAAQFFEPEGLSTRIEQAINEKIDQMLTRERYALDVTDQTVLDIVADRELPTTPPIELKGRNKELRDAQPIMKFDDLANYKPETEGAKLFSTYEEITLGVAPIMERLSEHPDQINSLSEDEIHSLQRLLVYTRVPAEIDINDASMELTTSLSLLFQRLQHQKGMEATAYDAQRLQNLYDTFKQEVVFQESRFDKMTGLKNRGEYYLAMADSLKNAEALPEGQSVRTMFIDLGFLQYFNTGGREVGNLAIQRTGELLERALERAGINGEAFRYAGDEFTILFNGSEDDQVRLLASLDAVRGEIGEIPRTERSGELYRPEKLMLNYGSADHQNALAVMDALYERGAIKETDIPRNSTEYYAYLANLQTRMADLGVESQKAQSRFRFMHERMRHDFPAVMPSEEDMDILQRQTELLVKYSQKALLGESLMTLHQMAYNPDYLMWDENDNPIPEGFARLEQYVASKKKVEEVVVTSTRQLEDLIVRNSVERDQNSERIAKLQGEVSNLQEMVRINQARAEQVAKALEEEKEDELKIEALRHELAGHHERTATLAQKEQQLADLEARQAEILRQLREAEVQVPPPQEES